MSSPQTYLISGASNGLGFEVASLLLARPGNTVIVSVRDVNALSELEAASRGSGSTLIIVKIDSTSETDAPEAVAKLQSEYKIQHLDVVFANASNGTIFGKTTEVTTKDMRENFEANTLGPLKLFLATLPLLTASKKPQFVVAGSPIGSIAGMEQAMYPLVALGASKAAVHHFTRRVHCEHEGVIAYCLDPGFMKTRTGNTGARYLGLTEAFVDPKDSAKWAVNLFDNASKEETSGKFHTISHGGGVLQW